MDADTTRSNPGKSTSETAMAEVDNVMSVSELNNAVHHLSDFNRRQSRMERGAGGDNVSKTSNQSKSKGTKKSSKRNKNQVPAEVKNILLLGVDDITDRRIQCNVCKDPGILQCAGCDDTWYCGAKHLQEEWTRHRIRCFPMTRVDEDDDSKVKYLQATKDLRKGNIIIYEKAYFSFGDPTIDFGDQISHDVDSFSHLNKCSTKVICVGCFNDINPSYAKIFNCIMCQSPVCKRECAESEPHANSECEILKTLFTNGRQNIGTILEGRHFAGQVFYDLVSVIRVLLMKSKDPRSWFQLERLMFPIGDDAIRCGKNSHTAQQQEIISTYEKLFRYLEGLSGIAKHEDSENIINLCFRILNVLKRRGIGHGSGFGSFQRSLSPKASYIEHSCLPNVDICVTIKGEIMVKVLRPIRKGDKILSGLVNLLRPTYDRRLLLQIHRYSDCYCQRCLDSTEMETYFGSLKCYNLYGCNGVGFFKLENPENLGSFDKTLTWKCELCQFQTTHFYIMDRVRKMTKEVIQSSCEDDWNHDFVVNKLSKVLADMGGDLHENHFLAFACTRSRANLFGYKMESNTLCRLSTEDFKLKIQMCNAVSSVMEKLGLGFSTLNAETIHELLNLLVFKDNYFNPRTATPFHQEVIFNLACQLWNAVNHCDPETPLGEFSSTAESIIQTCQLSPANYPEIIKITTC